MIRSLLTCLAWCLFAGCAQTLSAAQLQIPWKYPYPDTPSGFVLERGTGNNATSFKAVGDPLPGTARSYTDTGLQKNKRYSYRIRAFNVTSAGVTIYSFYSNVVSAQAK